MNEQTPNSFWKIEDFTGRRREISERTTALFPEYFAGGSENELKSLFFERCKLAGKDAGENLYGSPNHGEQRLLYQGSSDIYTLSSMSTIEKKVWSPRIQDITNFLASGGSVLFTPSDVQAALQTRIVTEEINGILTLVNSIVAKDQLNGIILVSRPAQKEQR
jgi:hypothetical protein